VITPQALVDGLRRAAAEEGFALLGVTPAVSFAGFSDLVRWIESGYAGEMNYFADRQQAYRHPSAVLEDARSIIALAYPYDCSPFPRIPSGHGRIARYVWSGVDYHDVIHPKLKRIGRLICQASPNARARGVVDTAPLPERQVAQVAGLGWCGKNTLLLSKELGSYFFLACLLTNIELPYDAAHESSHCGTCTACLDACPTAAFPSAGVLDATRCISYLTIEHRGPIPENLRAGIGDWVFGCDICQEVCPWNRKPSRNARRCDDPLGTLDLLSLFTMNEDEFRDRFRKTPLWRTRRRGILRNAAIVLGNQRDERAVAALTRGLNDEQSLVRGASAWALGCIGGQIATAALQQRLETEMDEAVRNEIYAALGKTMRSW
jgi:epoxyqueuosine reductase